MRSSPSWGYSSGMRKPEILTPAGNREMLESAVIYGADAVYLGLDGGLNLRAAARNFSPEDLCDAVTFAHAHAVRVYLTLNAFPHDHEFERLNSTIEAARAAKVDALIVADAGVLATARELAPEISIHRAPRPTRSIARRCVSGRLRVSVA